MLLSKIPLLDSHSFSDFFLDYVHQKDCLKPFYGNFPTLVAFKKQITEKQKYYSQNLREVLTSTLLHQYKEVHVSDPVLRNIGLLKESNTFTITTGHQLNIFTGPLYFIYKIVTVINTCHALKDKYPEYNFIPVYWMASEDHDYDEIKSFNLYGKKYTWETGQQGAVGRFTTAGLKQLIDQLPGDVSIFQHAYTNNKSLSDATRDYVNQLFGNEGLIVIDADTLELKSQFKSVIAEDILNHSTKPLVETTNSALDELGYKTQVFCREINFFYLDENLRSRIEKNENQFNVIDTRISFSREEIKNEIERYPEKFSPNVILRPLYQEIILPNLAYVGGPAEMMYWLQLKEVFNYHTIPFPILLPRNFALIVNKGLIRKFNKTQLEWKDLFLSRDEIFKKWIRSHSRHNLSIKEEQDAVNNIYASLRYRSEAIDKTLGMFVGAEHKRSLDSLRKIEQKMVRAEKRVQQEKLGQISAIKDALFPSGGLQERVDNFLNFYQSDNMFISKLIGTFDPFDFQFNILEGT